MLQLTLKSTGKTFELTNGRITVGRDDSNTLQLNHKDISGFHAEFHCENNKVYLVDLGSSNGTFVNGKSLLSRIELKAWDSISFASMEAEIIDTSSRRPTQISKAITEDDIVKAAKQGLNVSETVEKSIESAKSEWKLSGANARINISGSMNVGRESSCDITVNSQQISRSHAQISIKGNVVTLKDLNSANGTFVNGIKITEKQLQVGDKIKFDVEEFILEGPTDNKTQVRAAIDPAKTQLRGAVDQNKTQTRPAHSATTAGANSTKVMPSIVPKLDVIKGVIGSKSILLSKQSYSIGRTDINDISLNNDSVSTQHAKLESINGEWKVIDQGSTNGTFVNNKRANLAILASGDEIRFGEVVCKFNNDSLSNKDNKTKVIPSATFQSTTSHPTKVTTIKKPMPAWIYGLAGFLVVTIGMGAFLFKDDLSSVMSSGQASQIEAKLQAGKTWSVSLPQYHGVVATPAMADINNDGFLDVVIADQKGFVTALDGQEGKEIFQAQIADSINASVTIADITGDGNQDIIVASDSGIVRALDSKGQTLWTSDENLNMGAIVNKPTIADVDNDGVLDVIVPTKNRGLVALNGNRGWEIWNTAETIKGAVIGSPLNKDINNDGIVDFVSVTDSGQVMAVSAQNGKAWQLWEVAIPKVKYASPVSLILGEQSLIIVATADDGVYAIDGTSGRIVWNALEGQSFFSTPVIADTNGDDISDVIVTTQNGNVFVLSAQYGEDLNSSNIQGKFIATTASYDINDDGIDELFMLSHDGNLIITDTNRLRPELNVKIANSAKITASPILGDINNDGMLDVIIAAGNGTVSAYSINRTTRKGQVVQAEFLGRTQE